MGTNQHAIDDLVVPRCACRRSAPRRDHAPPSCRRSAPARSRSNRLSITRCLPGREGRSHVYHSRWNDVLERDLVAAGYQILTRGSVGVDSFIKRDLWQLVRLPSGSSGIRCGRARTRVSARCLAFPVRRTDERYPTLPVGYFDRATIDALRHASRAEATPRTAIPDDHAVAALPREDRRRWPAHRLRSSPFPELAWPHDAPATADHASA